MALALAKYPQKAPQKAKQWAGAICAVQVLQSILPGWLLGEGDVLRSLGRLGYKLQYEQAPKREVDFAVANLAVDLRDGLRLCKLADILLGALRGGWGCSGPSLYLSSDGFGESRATVSLCLWGKWGGCVHLTSCAAWRHGRSALGACCH